MTSGSSSKSSLPLVSVIIPSYNYGHFIGQALESVQAQTHQHWECIVVDDGSTDDTNEMVNRYVEKDNRIKYVYQKNQGLAAGRNTGIRNSSGKYLQFLDADDLIEPKKLEFQSACLEQHAEIDLVYGDVRYFTTEKMDERLHSMWGEDKPWMREVSGSGQDILRILVRSNIMVVNAPLIRRSVVDALGFFDGTAWGVEDWDYWIRCAAQGKLFQYQNMEGTLALVRSHPTSMSKDSRGMLTGVLAMRKKFSRSNAETNTLKLNRGLIAQDEGLLGVEEVVHGNLVKGICNLLKAGLLSREMRHRMKWFVCALVSPFVSKQDFRKVVSSSITQHVADVLKSRNLGSSR